MRDRNRGEHSVGLLKAVVDAILAGQRDLLELAKLRGERIKASEAVIAKSLVGDYRHEHLFTLKQSLEATAAIRR